MRSPKTTVLGTGIPGRWSLEQRAQQAMRLRKRGPRVRLLNAGTSEVSFPPESSCSTLVLGTETTRTRVSDVEPPGGWGPRCEEIWVPGTWDTEDPWLWVSLGMPAGLAQGPGTPVVSDLSPPGLRS